MNTVNIKEQHALRIVQFWKAESMAFELPSLPVIVAGGSGTRCWTYRTFLLLTLMVFDLPHFSVWNLALQFQFLKLCADEKGRMQTIPGSLASFAPNSPIIDLGGTKQGIQKVCCDNDGFESFLKPELDELVGLPAIKARRSSRDV